MRSPMKVGSTDFTEDDDFIEAKPQIALDTLNKLCFQSPVCRPRATRIWGCLSFEISET
jgi:hypothetical protein